MAFVPFVHGWLEAEVVAMQALETEMPALETEMPALENEIPPLETEMPALETEMAFLAMAALEMPALAMAFVKAALDMPWCGSLTMV